MQSQPDDSALTALDGTALRAELARSDWKNDPLFVKDEQVFRLFHGARAAGDADRMGLLSRELCRRMLRRAKSFAARSGIYTAFSSLDEAAEELSQYVWERLVTQPKDAAYAEQRFGKLFLLRAIDFQRRVLAKKRSQQERFEEEMAHTGDDEAEDENAETILLEMLGHENEQQSRQHAAEIATRLQQILTKREYSTFVMRKVNEMKVKEIAALFDVDVKTINNYKNAALEKIRKEFPNDK